MPRMPDVTTGVDEELEVPCAGRCSGQTYHRVLARAERDEANEEMRWTQRSEIIQCMGCGHVSFRQWSESSEDWEYDAEGNMVSSPTVELFPGRIAGGNGMPDAYHLPPKIANVYRETRAALASKLRVLAGVGTRALVEAVCVDQNAQGKNLEQRIDGLVDTGVLSKPAAEFLHSTRLVGNEAAHEVEAESDDILVAALGVAEYLLLHVYLMERRVRNLPRRRAKASVPAGAVAAVAPGVPPAQQQAPAVSAPSAPAQPAGPGAASPGASGGEA